MGVGPLSHQEMEAWARLYQVEISPSEADALRRIDTEFRAYHNTKDKAQESSSSAPIADALREVKAARDAERSTKPNQKSAQKKKR